MRIVLCAILCMLSCNLLYADTYEKASDNQLRIVTEVTKEEVLTVPQIQHEINGIDADLARIEESYTKQRGEFEARKARYEAMLTKCEELNIAEPVIIELNTPLIGDLIPGGDEVVEPTEPDNG